MNEIGSIIVTLSGAVLFFIVTVSLSGINSRIGKMVSHISGIRTQERAITLSRQAFYINAILAGLAFSLLTFLMIAGDLQNTHVVEHHSNDLPFFIQVGSVWANLRGSALLWYFILTLISALAVYQIQVLDKKRLATLYLLLSLPGLVTILTLLFFDKAHPFHIYTRPMLTGAGLDPKWQEWPAILYVPLTSIGGAASLFLIAFALSAIISSSSEKQNWNPPHKWVLASWIFLGAGMVLSYSSSYDKFGIHNAFPFWNPVENVNLIPFIFLTALFHWQKRLENQTRTNKKIFFGVPLIHAGLLFLLIGLTGNLFPTIERFDFHYNKWQPHPSSDAVHYFSNDKGYLNNYEIHAKDIFLTADFNENADTGNPKHLIVSQEAHFEIQKGMGQQRAADLRSEYMTPHEIANRQRINLEESVLQKISGIPFDSHLKTERRFYPRSDPASGKAAARIAANRPGKISGWLEELQIQPISIQDTSSERNGDINRLYEYYYFQGKHKPDAYAAIFPNSITATFEVRLNHLIKFIEPGILLLLIGSALLYFRKKNED